MLDRGLAQVFLGTGPATFALQIVNKRRLGTLRSSMASKNVYNHGFGFLGGCFCFVAVTCMHPTLTERFREIISLHELRSWLIKGLQVKLSGRALA